MMMTWRGEGGSAGVAMLGDGVKSTGISQARESVSLDRVCLSSGQAGTTSG